MIEVDLIKKHGKKALGMEEHGGHPSSWRARIPEILLEIGIIVFAIMLSIQLHSWHEHALDREVERKFLLGLRADLQSDLREMTSDSAAYGQMQRGYRYFRALSPQTVNPDSVRKYQWVLTNETNLVPNTSRFEGLKSSGKLGVIENEELLNALLENYQELTPSLLNSTQAYTLNKQQKLQSYLEDHLSYRRDNFLEVMMTDPVHNYLNRDGTFQEIIGRYHKVMANNRHLLRLIDAQLGPGAEGH